MSGKKPGPGRKPTGIGEDGKPVKVSEYPHLTILIRPEMRVRLRAVSELLGKSPWQVVDSALEAYINSLPRKDREAVEALARRAKIRSGK